MATIEELLHRRTDLSTFLVHLTRDTDDASARDNLLSIAEESVIEARTPFGPAAQLEEHLGGGSSQKAVCFTETPLEHTWMLLEDIEKRAVRFRPYGLAITKTTARKAHCNPVWYSDISTRGGRDWPMVSVNRLVKDAVERCTEDDMVDKDALASEPVFRLTPFIEQMGPTSNGGRKEFWWEREWRHVGNFTIPFPRRIVALLAPEDDHDQLCEDLQDRNEPWSRRPLLDPSWGLERMIVQLAEIDPLQVGPFPDA